MLIVIDTNVLVSAVLTPSGKAAWLIGQTLAGKFKICYDYRILEEYREVLLRPKFYLSESFVEAFLTELVDNGISVIPTQIDIPFDDEDDKKFFEVAKYCQAPLVTGNLRHFPHDPLVKNLSDFCLSYMI